MAHDYIKKYYCWFYSEIYKELNKDVKFGIEDLKQFWNPYPLQCLKLRYIRPGKT